MTAWFRRNQRPLPWRRTKDPYSIWVSEIMLQQTRAAAVEPYYERFLQRFPDLRALAGSSDAELLRCWSGLGYYSRARNLRWAAQHILSRLGGRFPTTYEQWKALPGVGPYTAAAVASIAFGAPVAVLDGNVARVMARVANHHGDVRSPAVREELRGQAQELLGLRGNKATPGEFNQALMELGATVCLLRNPRCLLCPVSAHCQAFQLGLQNELPVKGGAKRSERSKIAVALVEQDGSLLLRQRSQRTSLMPGFWELPQAEGAEAAPEGVTLGPRLRQFRHTITYHEYTVTVYRSALQGTLPAGHRWVAREKLKTLPLTTITRKALEPPLDADQGG